MVSFLSSSTLEHEFPLVFIIALIPFLNTYYQTFSHLFQFIGNFPLVRIDECTTHSLNYNVYLFFANFLSSSIINTPHETVVFSLPTNNDHVCRSLSSNGQNCSSVSLPIHCVLCVVFNLFWCLNWILHKTYYLFPHGIHDTQIDERLERSSCCTIVHKICENQ